MAINFWGRSVCQTRNRTVNSNGWSEVLGNAAIIGHTERWELETDWVYKEDAIGVASMQRPTYKL